MRHFYANPHFSMVPKTITYGLEKLSYLFVVLSTIMLVYGTYISVVGGQYLTSLTNPIDTFMTLHLSLLGELDYYDDVNSNLHGASRFFWFLNHVWYSMIALVVVMNIFLTVVMDAYAAAKNVEDKKAAVMDARSNSKHVAQRLARARFQDAYRTTLNELKKEQKRRAGGTSVVPVEMKKEEQITDERISEQ